jgi:CxxC motif-containing protein (DUF1111 family)
MKPLYYPLLAAVGIFAITACEKLMPAAPSEDEVLDGTVEGLTFAQNAQFLRGDIAFTRNFTPATGLGPLFVSNSCISCHAGDGKGHPSTNLVRFGQNDETGNQFLHLGGPQLQNRANPGNQPEVIPSGATFSTFMAPANTGLGYLDAVSDADILKNADPDDKNGDGISGVPNWVEIPDFVKPRPNSISKEGKYIGRFGRKAGAFDLLKQTVGAYNQDMGIVSSFSPHDTQSGHEIDPEVSNVEIEDVVFYLKTLKAPIQRNTSDDQVVAGKQVFVNIQCGSCHLPNMKTGSSPIKALNNVTFAPYTDLLMHDMGKELDDNYTEGTAKTSEWRTTPLWGLGLSKNSQGGSLFLMHDGRAETIEQAILLHGGEGDRSRQRYKALSATEKQHLITFLESL